MLRILIAHYLPNMVSGAELAISEIVRKAANDLQFTMLVPGEGHLARQLRQQGHTVWTRKVETPRRKYPGLHALQSMILAAELRARAIQVVVCNTFPAASRIGTACSLARIPYAIYVREYIRDIPLHRKILRSAKRVFAVSDDVRGHLLAMQEGGAISTVPDFLDLPAVTERLAVHRRSGKRVLPFDAGTPVVGYVGRITAYKQPDLFIRAIPNILGDVPRSRFVVAGAAVPKEEAYAAELKDLAHQLGLQDHLVFMGHRSDALELISELTVLAFSSVRDPFPRVILEAQAAGVPVVASDSGGCPEMIRDGESGLLFVPSDPGGAESLAARVITLLRDASERRRLANRARQALSSGSASSSVVDHFETELRAVSDAGR